MQAYSQTYNQPLADESLIGCPRCDLLQRLPQLEPGAAAQCPRCDETLWHRRADSMSRTLSLTVAAAILYVIANTVPMLGLTILGHAASTTVMGGAMHLWNDGRQLVALLVLFTAIVAPALQICLMLAITLRSRQEHPPRWVGVLLRYHPDTQVWSMVEVMILGVLIALVKIADYARVIPGIALFALGVLVFLLAAIQVTFDPREVWERIEWAGAVPDRRAAEGRTAEAAS